MDAHAIVVKNLFISIARLDSDRLQKNETYLRIICRKKIISSGIIELFRFLSISISHFYSNGFLYRA